MRKWIALILCAFIFCGCHSQQGDLDGAMSLRQRTLSAQSVSFSCKVSADYSQVVHTFSLSCTYEKEGRLSFEVTAPESISGITGYFDKEGGNLTFDDHVLAFPMLADGQISPVSAPWLFMKTLCYGYIRGVASENSQMCIKIDDSYESDPIEVDIWTDPSYNPLGCEFLWQGRRFLSMEIINFTLM